MRSTDYAAMDDPGDRGSAPEETRRYVRDQMHAQDAPAASERKVKFRSKSLVKKRSKDYIGTKKLSDMEAEAEKTSSQVGQPTRRARLVGTVARVFGCVPKKPAAPEELAKTKQEELDEVKAMLRSMISSSSPAEIDAKLKSVPKKYSKSVIEEKRVLAERKTQLLRSAQTEMLSLAADLLCPLGDIDAMLEKYNTRRRSTRRAKRWRASVAAGCTSSTTSSTSD